LIVWSKFEVNFRKSNSEHVSNIYWKWRFTPTSFSFILKFNQILIKMKLHFNLFNTFQFKAHALTAIKFDLSAFLIIFHFLKKFSKKCFLRKFIKHDSNWADPQTGLTQSLLLWLSSNLWQNSTVVRWDTTFLTHYNNSVIYQLYNTLLIGF
jgi:hypothetical protein